MSYPPGGTCYNFGVASASCSIGGVAASAFIGVEPYTNSGLALVATGEYGPNDYSGAVGEAFLNGTLGIIGGSGTGYLEIQAAYSGATQIAGASIAINNQYLTPSNYIGFVWTLVPFTFGQPVNYNLQVWSNFATASLSVSDVRIYGHLPSGCIYRVYEEACPDPDYLDLKSLLTPNAVSSGSGSSITQLPEPGTMWIAGPGLAALFVFRRFVSGSGRKCCV